MGKDTRLINIYLKIHNKRPITMDDLDYLAQHDPECFEKTCKNVVYNIPQAKQIMDPIVSKAQIVEWKPEPFARQYIDTILDNLKRLEASELLVESVDADEVKSLLGNLYMELLFPHNDKDTFFDMADLGNVSFFDKKA